MRGSAWLERVRRIPAAAALAGIVLAAAFVNPVAAWQTAMNDYSDHPDHKGAAEFIRSLNLDPRDIIIAEDSINQTYYLGKVDYRLQNFTGAKNHSLLKNGILYDQYSGRPVIGSGLELQALLDRETAGKIYIVGDGQASETLSRRNRANGIAEVLQSNRLQVIYVGRDRKTKVWKPRR
jgi:hypothetical protein